ncbi:MAG: hypothetical protein U1E28_12855 [Beijerinckiaceae bacterium]
MIITGILFSILGVGLLCWLLFMLAVQALPFFIGAAAGALLSQNGAGAALAITVGLVSAMLVSGVAQFLYATTRSPLTRSAIALLVAGPAAFAGYHASLGIARIGLSAAGSCEVLALIGASAIGSVAFARLSAMTRRSSDLSSTGVGRSRVSKMAKTDR